MSPEQCVHIGWNAELVSSLLEFIERLRDIRIDVVEFCLLNAIILTYPGTHLVSWSHFAPSLGCSSVFTDVSIFKCQLKTHLLNSYFNSYCSHFMCHSDIGYDGVLAWLSV